MIKKGLGLIDCKHDSRNRYECVQLNSTEWFVWCFDDEDDLNERNQWPWNELTEFKWLKKFSVMTLHSRNFLCCNCSFCERVGFLCRHMMVDMSGLVKISTIDICWLNAYHVHHKDDSELGKYFGNIIFLFFI